MAYHEEKNCPRCNTRFECKVGSISLCQCATVKLDKEEYEYINLKYDDCLCARCMKTLKMEHRNLKHQQSLQRILGVYYKKDNGNN
ncbi:MULTISPECIES: cysteine-rich CWC family protein [Flavobacteriaceae]|uniref:cysteine-rich CWC family protein n=1 Tax=Flavobacteriaceae TaxID=49546 RepID=UPI00234BC859|nr:cysteine-rich CWC family protein [Muricauda sp. SP22]MDC6361729.1 cysteine-rich CWC family protein [Muricauda sp. SP22]